MSQAQPSKPEGAARFTPARHLLRELLARSLPNVRPETLARLIETVRARTVQPGHPIYRQGDPVPLTIIVEGYGAAQRTTLDGREIVSGVALAGTLFGWSGMAAVPSSVELVALTACEIGQWQGPEVRKLAAGDPGLALAAIDSMAWSLHQTVQRIEGFLHQDARLHVIRVLAQYRELFFGDPPILTRSHLPGLVGTSREMTGRVLRQLEREGTVARVGRDRLRLLRPEQLEFATE